MTSRISHERAKELLEGDFSTATRQEWAGSLQADFDNFSGAYIDGTPGDFALAEASYELAQTIAEMRYQYLVEAQHLTTAAPNTWMPCDSLGLTGYDSIIAGEPWRGPQTWRTLESAKKCAETAQAYRDRDVRIMRRLVTDVEVVE